MSDQTLNLHAETEKKRHLLCAELFKQHKDLLEAQLPASGSWAEEKLGAVYRILKSERDAWNEQSEGTFGEHDKTDFTDEQCAQLAVDLIACAQDFVAPRTHRMRSGYMNYSLYFQLESVFKEHDFPLIDSDALTGDEEEIAKYPVTKVFDCLCSIDVIHEGQHFNYHADFDSGSADFVEHVGELLQNVWLEHKQELRDQSYRQPEKTARFHGVELKFEPYENKQNGDGGVCISAADGFIKLYLSDQYINFCSKRDFSAFGFSAEQRPGWHGFNDREFEDYSFYEEDGLYEGRDWCIGPFYELARQIEKLPPALRMGYEFPAVQREAVVIEDLISKSAELPETKAVLEQFAAGKEKADFAHSALGNAELAALLGRLYQSYDYPWVKELLKPENEPRLLDAFSLVKADYKAGIKPAGLTEPPSVWGQLLKDCASGRLYQPDAGEKERAAAFEEKCRQKGYMPSFADQFAREVQELAPTIEAQVEKLIKSQTEAVQKHTETQPASAEEQKLYVQDPHAELYTLPGYTLLGTKLGCKVAQFSADMLNEQQLKLLSGRQIYRTALDAVKNNPVTAEEKAKLLHCDAVKDQQQKNGQNKPAGKGRH